MINQTQVVIRNFHPTTLIKLIKFKFERRLFEVRQVLIVLHKINKHSLPLFFVNLEPTNQSNDIFQLKSLLHTIIKVEKPHKSNTISQCTISKFMDTLNHIVAIRLAAFAAALIMHRQTVQIPEIPHPSAPFILAITHQITKNAPSIEISNNEKIQNHNHLSNNLSVKYTNVQKTHALKSLPIHPPGSTLTYAQVTSNSYSNHTVSTPTPDINKIMSSFIVKFKQLINLLIVLIIKVISKLLLQK